MIATGLNHGGAEVQVVQLALRLKSRGHQIWCVSLTPLGSLGIQLVRNGVPVFSLNVRRKLPDPRPLLQLARLVRVLRPDVVHSHMVHANILARIVRVVVPVPALVCTAHSVLEAQSRISARCRELAYRLTDPLCDITVQVSLVGLQRYVRIGAVPRHKITSIPNGVDTRRFRPDPSARRSWRAQLGVEDTFVWLAVGRLAPEKDYPNLLRAFAHVTREQNALLLIAGDGPLRAWIEQLAHELGLRQQVKFVGLRGDVPELMNAADAYVMSSAWEGMPMVLLEAAATGLPIVATNVGGNSEVVLDEQTGFLVPPGDPQALAGAMLRLMRLPYEIRQKMGHAGRAHVQAYYDLERVVTRWEALYCRLLRQK